MEHWWNDTDRRNLSAHRKTCSSATWTGLDQSLACIHMTPYNREQMKVPAINLNVLLKCEQTYCC